jgi:hypothetical protein
MPIQGTCGFLNLNAVRPCPDSNLIFDFYAQNISLILPNILLVPTKIIFILYKDILYISLNSIYVEHYSSIPNEPNATTTTISLPRNYPFVLFLNTKLHLHYSHCANLLDNHVCLCAFNMKQTSGVSQIQRKY